MPIERSDSWEIPLREISALSVRKPGEPAEPAVLAVGDESWAVAALALAPQGATPLATAEVASALAEGGVPTDESSEFEGVASDARGLVFVLREGPARVLVLDPAMSRLLHTIALHVAPEHHDVGASWDAQPNARAEGLLLMRDGHLLVAKQRDPVRLMEFGPAGEPPLGYSSERALGGIESFALGGASASVLELLATWSLDPAANVASINDLAVGGDGRLHFVSSLSRCVGRIDADFTAAESVVATSTAALPAELFIEEDDKAEVSCSPTCWAGFLPSICSAPLPICTDSRMCSNDRGRCHGRRGG